MEQLSHLKERISSLQDLGGLIRALRALSASHVQEAQSALTGIQSYVETVEDAVVQGVDLLPGAKPPARIDGKPKTDVVIAVCSEHGFVGAFNERLLDEAAGRLTQADLAVIGAELEEKRELEAMLAAAPDTAPSATPPTPTTSCRRPPSRRRAPSGSRRRCRR